MVDYNTLLDAARLHFAAVAASPLVTREARHKALALRREVEDELNAANRGQPLRLLIPVPGAAAAWEGEPEPLRTAA